MPLPTFGLGFPGGLVLKNLPANAGDSRNVGSIPGPGRSPGEGNGNPLRYSCLENPMDRGAWQATSWGHRVRHDWAQTHLGPTLSWIIKLNLHFHELTKNATFSLRQVRKHVQSNGSSEFKYKQSTCIYQHVLCQEEQRTGQWTFSLLYCRHSYPS